MKSVWRGSISFGLISIDVELFSAIHKRSGVNFDLLHEKCQTPLNYKRWCQHCDKEVAWEDTVKGLKMEDNSYFLVTPENRARLKEEKTATLALIGGINAANFDELYFDEHYYVVPEKKSEHAYFLLSETLQKLQKYIIGHFIMHQKEYLCVIRSYNHRLLLTTLHYAADIRPFPKKTEKIPSISKQELQLADLLIKRLSSKKIDLTAFKNRFMEKLQILIKEYQRSPRKKSKKKTKISSTRKKVINSSLIDALQASLGKINKPQPAIRARS